jgi:hypothetical protein
MVMFLGSDKLSQPDLISSSIGLKSQFSAVKC